MLDTLKLILKEHWDYRHQILGLALTEIKKETRGTAFGWAWLIVKPAVYISVFWFALELGLKAGSTTGSEAPFLLWLAAGLFPWFFMQSMLSSGSNVYKKYPYLVNKLTFPVSVINTFYALSKLIVACVLLGIVLAVCLIFGFNRSIYLIQVPFIILIMGLFWILFSWMTSPLSAISGDFANLIKVLSTPLFWLSGIIFNIHALGIPTVETVLAFDPVNTFAMAFRDAFYYQRWVWESPDVYLPFILVFVCTFAVALLVQKALRKDVADVL